MSSPNMQISPDVPTDLLERRAAEQRKRLHNSVQELRAAVRERFDLKRNLHEYFGPAAGAAALIGLILGYSSGAVVRR